MWVSVSAPAPLPTPTPMLAAGGTSTLKRRTLTPHFLPTGPFFWARGPSSRCAINAALCAAPPRPRDRDAPPRPAPARGDKEASALPAAEKLQPEVSRAASRAADVRTLGGAGGPALVFGGQGPEGGLGSWAIGLKSPLGYLAAVPKGELTTAGWAGPLQRQAATGSFACVFITQVRTRLVAR